MSAQSRPPSPQKEMGSIDGNIDRWQGRLTLENEKTGASQDARGSFLCRMGCMTMQEIRRLRERQPFEPFRIISAHGEHYDVRHPENIAITGNGRLIAVAMPDYVATL